MPGGRVVALGGGTHWPGQLDVCRRLKPGFPCRCRAGRGVDADHPLRTPTGDPGTPRRSTCPAPWRHRSLVWWSAALNQLPLQVAYLVAIGAWVRYLRSRPLDVAAPHLADGGYRSLLLGEGDPRPSGARLPRRGLLRTRLAVAPHRLDDPHLSAALVLQRARRRRLPRHLPDAHARPVQRLLPRLGRGARRHHGRPGVRQRPPSAGHGHGTTSPRPPRTPASRRCRHRRVGRDRR